METESIKELDCRKEYAIGEKFVLDDFVFECKYPQNMHNCVACVLIDSRKCHLIRCQSKRRKDATNVSFDFEKKLYELLTNAAVGEIIAYRGYFFKVIKTDKCNKCFFSKYRCRFPCIADERKDHTDVAFVLVGE